jgi:PKD repeat protein/lysophospholipase L1-like esterase
MQVDGVSFCLGSSTCQPVYEASGDGTWRTSRDTRNLEDGDAVIYGLVSYRDRFGRPHSSSLSVPVTIDNSTPSVTLAATPSSGQAPMSVHGSISAYQPHGAELSYQLDFGDESSPQSGSISTPYDPVEFDHVYATVGNHRLRAVVSDGKGHTAERSVYVSVKSSGDDTPPAVVFQKGPVGSIPRTTATFAFRSTEEGSSFFCSFDGPGFEPCSSPTTREGLAEGEHAFSVKARDLAGNLSLPLTRKFTVDTTPPETTIDAGPSAQSDDPSPSFSFSSEEPSTFRCSLDGAAAVPCSSPKPYPALSKGGHDFSVTAIDRAGNVDRSPATSHFLIEPPATPNHPPSLQLAVEQTAGKAPLHLKAALETSDADGDELDSEVSFGDGSDPIRAPISTGLLEHTYDHPGSYLLDVHVDDGRDTVERSAVVVVSPQEPLLADAGDDLHTLVGEPVSFGGGNSRPAGAISQYSWDFGDGSGGAGPTPEHTYAAPGEYEVTLTVSGGGESSTDKAKVVVEPSPKASGLAVHVSGAGQPLAGATVSFIRPDGSRLSAASDGSGTAQLAGMPEGVSTIYVAAAGFRPTAAQAEVADGAGTVNVDLAAGEMGAATIESTRLTYEEILEKGIDVADPENSHVYEAKIHLFFVPDEPEPKVIDVYITPAGVECFSNCAGGSGGGGGGGGGGLPSGGGGPITFGGYQYLPKVQYVGGEPLIQWLVLPIRASFLKEFFEVKMIVENLTNGIDFSPGVAALELPQGLTLAPTAQPQSAVQSVEAVRAGKSRTVSWVVRGDTEGEYDLEAGYSATAPAVEEPVYLRARTQTPLKVWGASALKTKILVDEKATRWGPYAFEVAITNVSDTPVYNMQVEMLDREADAPEEEALFFYAPFPPQVQGTAEIAPGETWTAHYVVFAGLGNEEVTRMRVLLAQSFVERTGGDVDLQPELGIRKGPSIGPGAGPVEVDVERKPGSSLDEAVLHYSRPEGVPVEGYGLWTRQALDGGEWRQYRRGIPPSGGKAETFRIPATRSSEGRYYAIGTELPNKEVRFMHSIGVGPPRYVAMGDSFSAGEGVPVFSADSNQPGDRCHRSERGSYSRRLVADRSIDANLQPAIFAACSGAIVRDIETDNPRNVGERAQDSHVSQFTNLVTLTMGGNDIGFGDIARLCTALDCAELLADKAPGTQSWLDEASSMWIPGQFLQNRIQQKLGTADPCIVAISLAAELWCGYQEIKAIQTVNDTGDKERIATPSNLENGILEKRLTSAYLAIAHRAPNAQILVLRYPQIATGSSGRACKLYGDLPVTLTDRERATIETIIGKLNDKVALAVARADDALAAEGRARQVEVVDPEHFKGHELCTNETLNPGSYFNSVAIPHVTGDGSDEFIYSFHPNANGQQAFERDLADKLRGEIQAGVVTVRPAESVSAGTSFVPFGGRNLRATAAWPGSTVTMSLLSPGGVTFDASTDGVRQGSTATSEWLEVADPEPGVWHVQLFGEDVSVEGEPVQVSAAAESPPPQAPDVDVTFARVSEDPEQFDLEAHGPAGTGYEWTFSDGSSAIGGSVSHIFSDGGRRWATLHAVGSDGGEAWSQVELGPPADDSDPPTFFGVPDQLAVESTSSDGVVVYYDLPLADDAVEGEVPVSCSPSSGSVFPPGTTEVHCEAVDSSGNRTTVSFHVSVGGTLPPPPPSPPGKPTLSGISPSSPADDQHPTVLGAAAAGSTVRIYGNATCVSPPLGAGQADGGGHFSVPVTVPDGSTTSLSATAETSAGISECSAPITYVELGPSPPPSAGGDGQQSQERVAPAPAGTSSGSSPQTPGVTPPPAKPAAGRKRSAKCRKLKGPAKRRCLTRGKHKKHAR